MNNLIEFLKQEGVSAQLVEEVRHYSEEHTVDEALKKRIPVPHFHYYGNKVWEEALAVLLCGRNLLLAGEKARICENKKYIINTENLPLTGSLYYFAESFCI